MWQKMCGAIIPFWVVEQLPMFRNKIFLVLSGTASWGQACNIQGQRFSLEIEHVHVTPGHTSWCSKEQSLWIHFPKHFEKHKTHGNPDRFDSTKKRIELCVSTSPSCFFPTEWPQTWCFFFWKTMMEKNWHLELSWFIYQPVGISLFFHFFPWLNIPRCFACTQPRPRSWPISSSAGVPWWSLAALPFAGCGWSSWRNCWEVMESIFRTRGPWRPVFYGVWPWGCP